VLTQGSNTNGLLSSEGGESPTEFFAITLIISVESGSIPITSSGNGNGSVNVKIDPDLIGPYAKVPVLVLNCKKYCEISAPPFEEGAVQVITTSFPEIARVGAAGLEGTVP